MAVSTVGALVVVVVQPIQRPEHPAIAWLDEHAKPGDTAVVAFGAANILQATGLRSPYPDLWSLPVRVHDPELRDLGDAPRRLRPPDLGRRRRQVPRLLGHRRHGRQPGARRPLRSRATTAGDWTIYRERTGRVTRRTATTAYAVLLLAWCWFVGIPNDPAGVVVWIWLGTIAWQVEETPRDHLAFWRDWWKPLLLMVVYWLGRGLADEIGIAPHYSMPIRVDEWLVFGAAPSRPCGCSRAWCGEPCVKTLPPHWYDVLLTTVYASHFLVALTLAGVLWVRNRDEWVRWLRRYITLLFAGLAIYVAYPMAPPWMAARDGYLPEVHRITSRGWSARRSICTGRR